MKGVNTDNNSLLEIEDLDTQKQKIDVKKDLAKYLYLDGSMNQKDIAERVGISEQTLTSWVKKYQWATLRKSLLTTKKQELSRLYAQLEELNTHILQKPEGSRWADSKEADIISKLTASIRQLETDTSIADIIDVFIKFGDYLRTVAPSKAKEITELQDSFIKSML